MIGIELVRDRQTKERATSERDALVMAAFRRGLLVLAAGANTIRLSPPLVITQEQARDGGQHSGRRARRNLQLLRF